MPAIEALKPVLMIEDHLLVPVPVCEVLANAHRLINALPSTSVVNKTNVVKHKRERLLQTEKRRFLWAAHGIKNKLLYSSKSPA